MNELSLVEKIVNLFHNVISRMDKAQEIKLIDIFKKGYFKAKHQKLPSIDILKYLTNELSQFKIIGPAMESIKHDIPKFWNTLTFNQKILVTALSPAIGLATAIGGLTSALMGDVVGAPLLGIALMLLIVSDSLLDFLEKVLKNQGVDPKKITPQQKTEGHRFKITDIIIDIADELNNQEIQFEEIQNNSENNNIEKNICSILTYLNKSQDCNSAFIIKNSKDINIDRILELNGQRVVFVKYNKIENLNYSSVIQYLGIIKYLKERLKTEEGYIFEGLWVISDKEYDKNAIQASKYFDSELKLIPFENLKNLCKDENYV